MKRKSYNMKDDAWLLPRIRAIIEERQTYGYRRVCAVLNRSLESEGSAVVNHKRVYRIMRQNRLLLRKFTGNVPGHIHDGVVETRERNTRWCSDGFEIPCDNGERVRVIFGLDTCDREIMAYMASNGGYTADMAQSVMLSCVEYRFGSIHTPHPVEWLTDNGSCFLAGDTRKFAEEIGLVCKYTPVRSPQSNGMAEAFVKTFKRDYVYSHTRPDARTVLINLGDWIEDYNENAPHKSLRMRSPREYIRQMEGLSAEFPRSRYRKAQRPQQSKSGQGREAAKRTLDRTDCKAKGA